MKSVAKYGFIFILGFALAWQLKKTSHENPRSPEPALCTDELSNAKLKLQTLAEKELAQIEKATTPAEKEERALHLLNELLKAFLVDLGLKLNLQTVTSMQSAKSSTAAPPQPTPPPNPAGAQAEGLVDSAKPPAKISGSGNEEKKKLELQMSQLENSDDIKKALDGLKSEDLFMELRKSQNVPPEKVQQLLGAFQGQLTEEVRGVTPLYVELQPSNKPNEFSYIIRAGRGKRKSETRGQGGLNNFSSGPGSSAPIYIEFDGGEAYMQMYFTQNGALDGLVYRNSKDQKKNFQFTGYAHLDRLGSM